MVSTAASLSYDPAPAFYFTVSVAGKGSTLHQQSQVDGSFQEVSGLEAKIEIERVPEGGENRFVHQLPGSTYYSNLLLRRGYVTKGSFLAEWAAQTVGSSFVEPVMTQTLIVMLLGPNHTPRASWNIWRAWPVRWAVGPFDSTKNDVLTEVLEFSYSHSQRVPGAMANDMVKNVSRLIHP